MRFATFAVSRSSTIGTRPLLARSIARLCALSAAILAALSLGGCAGMPADPLARIDTVVVIYAENRSFDNLYGLYPGANGIANALRDPASYTQFDRDGSVLPRLPPAWTASPAQAPAWAFVATLPNKPFQINSVQPGGAPGHAPAVASPDLVHRFYNNQMQINGGKNNQFAAWADAGGLSMGYYDGSSMALWKIAQQYTLADNFFQGAFGGSFLNHIWLVCACAPAWDNPPASRISKVDASGVRLVPAPNPPPSALAAAPKYAADLNLTPRLADGKYYAVNTTQPAFQPSGTPPAPGGDPRLADPAGGGSAANMPLPPIDSGSARTIGDTLSAKGVPWAWYAGAWNQALADRSAIYNNKSGPNFQAHHQPFNYFSRFDPTTPAGQAERAAHLKDYTDLVADIGRGTLPQVVFYKPQGSLNQHPGYTDVMSGDAHVAEVIAKLKTSPQWGHMAIIVTYDENGGFFDHVAPPKADQWGPGTRIPTLIVSPYAKKGFVDHTAYDTTSILKFISRRFGLAPLPGVRSAAGDLTASFDFSHAP
jgi:acid phosphatase